MTHIIEIRNDGIGMYHPQLVTFMNVEDCDLYLQQTENERKDSPLAPHKFRERPIPYPNGEMVGNTIQLKSGTQEWAIELVQRAFANKKSVVHRPSEIETLPRILEIDPESGKFKEIIPIELAQAD